MPKNTIANLELLMAESCGILISFGNGQAIGCRKNEISKVLVRLPATSACCCFLLLIQTWKLQNLKIIHWQNSSMASFYSSTNEFLSAQRASTQRLKHINSQIEPLQNTLMSLWKHVFSENILMSSVRYQNLLLMFFKPWLRLSQLMFSSLDILQSIPHSFRSLGLILAKSQIGVIKTHMNTLRHIYTNY